MCYQEIDIRLTRNADLELSMSPSMTSFGQKVHLIHDSGSYFDELTRLRHTDIQEYLVNNNNTVESMPLTTEDDSSVYKSEIDFESLVSEMTYGNGDDTTVNTNERSGYFSESVYNDTDNSTDYRTVEVKYSPESARRYRSEEDVPVNSDIGSQCLEQDIRVCQKYSESNPVNNSIFQKSTFNKDCITNNDDHREKGGNISKVEHYVGNDFFVDEDNNTSIIRETRLKNMFINNWTQGLPQTGQYSELLLPDVSGGISDTLLPLKSGACLYNSADEPTLTESACCRSMSPDRCGSVCSLSSVDEILEDVTKRPFCSISSLSSLSIEDYLLMPCSKSSSPNVPSRRSSIAEMADKESFHSRRSSLTSYLSRRPSQSFLLTSRPASPIIENTLLEQSDEFLKSTLTDVSRKSSASQSSAKSTLSMSIDSGSASSSSKSSIPDRRMSDDVSEISSISLSGLFAEREAMSMCSPDPVDDLNRNDTPSPSPFGHQLKYFQDKRKNQMFLVKSATARLGLNTRRNSYSVWRAEHLDTKGRPVLMKPEINVGQKTDVFTKERVTAINMAIEWVRDELHQLKEQDESLAHQFLEIRRTIHELKLDWSCENHREMLADAEDEINEIKNIKRVSDLPEHHTQDGILRNMTRRLGSRKYSIF